MKKLTGIFPALITPFKPDGKVNGDMIQKLVTMNLEKGVSGFYVGGSTAESYLLSPSERKYALEAVIEAVDGKADVIANIGLFATEHSMELAEHAAKAGATAISSVPPFYFPFTMEEYANYYVKIAEATGMPMIIYNIPAMSGVKFTDEDIERLFENDKIAGMKHTSFDLFQLQRVISHYPEKNIFIGHDEILLSAFAVGARAAIGSTFNFMAEKFIKIASLVDNNQMAEALKIQDEANEVIHELCRIGVFKGVKAALKLQGYDCGTCREPFLPLAKEDEESLKTVLMKNGCL